MLIWNPSKLTTKGKALLAKAQAGRCTIKITKAQTGSGQYSSGEATDTRTSLKAPVQTLPIHSKEIQNGSTLVLKVAITNKTSDTDVLKSGYEIREFGIFAQDPDDGEILYSIATASTSDYMPAYNGVIPSVISMSYYLEVANASSVTIVTAGGLALQMSLITPAKLRSRSRSSIVPLPDVIFCSISCNRLLPIRQGAHLPHDSSTVKSR